MLRAVTKNVWLMVIALFFIPIVGLMIQYHSSQDDSIAFARSGAVLIMFTLLVVWANHANLEKISLAERTLERQRRPLPVTKEQIIAGLSKPRKVKPQLGRQIHGGSNESIFEELEKDLIKKTNAKRKEIDEAVATVRDDIHVGNRIKANVKVAELIGGLSGTFIWGYGDLLGSKLIPFLGQIIGNLEIFLST